MAKAAEKSVTKASEPVNAMDYQEHQNTYGLFLWLTRWTVIACLGLLVAMMFGFFGGGGLIGGIAAYIVLMAIAFFLL